MPPLDESFQGIANALAERYGTPGLPARDDAPFRAMLETLLARSTDARKVAKALDRLGDEGLIEAHALALADAVELCEILRECGIASPPKSAAALQRVARWLVDRHGGSLDALSDAHATPTDQLREELVSLNGVGPPTADAMLLFALHRPAYPLDRATYRVLARHGWVDPWAGYDEARAVVEHACADEPEALGRFSSAMERLGREYCKASVPRCEQCPLRPFLPDGGPLGRDAE